MIPNTTPFHKLYEPLWVGVATFIGGTFAGSILLAMNYRSFGRRKEAWLSIIIGFITTVILPLPTLIRSPFYQFGITTIDIGRIPELLVALAAAYITKKLQGELIEKHLQDGGQVNSGWRAIAISIGCLIIGVLSIIFLCGLLNPYYRRQAGGI